MRGISIMRKWEVLYPYVFAIVVCVPILIFGWKISDVKNFSSILNSAVTISSIIIAFLATMISILISLANARIMRRINKGDAEGLLTTYINTSIISGLLLAVYSMILNIFLDSSGLVSNLLLAFFGSLLVFFILSSYRIILLISGILSNVLKENKEKDQGKPVFKTQMKDREEQL